MPFTNQIGHMFNLWNFDFCTVGGQPQQVLHEIFGFFTVRISARSVRSDKYIYKLLFLNTFSISSGYLLKRLNLDVIVYSGISLIFTDFQKYTWLRSAFSWAVSDYQSHP